uniref:Uncharacterized protein n=1 Tax=Meloidogyne enterolobii TaxID=390850 RepID=A0A6V7WWM0_MELEN|nr:unnamed protein product [Meloidogyne enterolobii]
MKQLVLNQFNVDGAVDDTIADDVFFVGNSIGVQFPQIGRTRRSQLYTIWPGRNIGHVMKRKNYAWNGNSSFWAQDE